jgi:cytochrome c-type biogenesis protein CcmH
VSWVLAIGLALIAFVAITVLRRPPRREWEAVGAALMLGIAGYAVQGSPDLPGAPRLAQVEAMDDPGILVELRQEFTGGNEQQSNKWVVIADGMVRNGQFQDAASVLLGATGDDPANAEAWLALGNALVAHADGQLTPAAIFAYRSAGRADPQGPGAPFFLGLGLAQSGRLIEARSLWASTLERAPVDAPWREGLAVRLARLDQIIAAAASAGDGR